MKYMRHYFLQMKVGDVVTLTKFRDKVLTINQILLSSDDPYGYRKVSEDAGGAVYEALRLVIVFPDEHNLSKVEVPANYEFEFLDWKLYDKLTIKLTTTDGDIIDHAGKELDLVVVGELESDESRRLK